MALWFGLMIILIVCTFCWHPDNDMERMEKRYQKFKIKHNFIEYTDCKKISVYNYDLIECVTEILDIIKQDLIQGVKNRAICLKIDESDYVKRMISRGRISEQGYKNSTLKTFNDYYNNNFN